MIFKLSEVFDLESVCIYVCMCNLYDERLENLEV